MIPVSIDEAKSIHQKRSRRARDMDEATTSRRVFKAGTAESRLWAKRPGRYDLETVDTGDQGKYAKAFERVMKRVSEQAKQKKFQAPRTVKNRGEAFQFRGSKLYVNDVIQAVYIIVQSQDARRLYKQWHEMYLAQAEAHKPSDAIIKKFGDGALIEYKRNVAMAGHYATTGVLNKAFGTVMGGGCTNNPHAPEKLEEVDEAVLLATLNRIRKIRMGTVHRNYSSRGR